MMSIVLLILFLSVRTIDSQNTCNDSRAICMNARECPPIIELLLDPRRLKAEKLQILREAHCGFQGNDPLVCCVNQTTPLPTPMSTQTLETQEASAAVPEPPDVSNHRNLHLLEQNCGPIAEKKIVGKNKTEVFEYPWMALLAYNTKKGVEFHCGGTILNKRYILTAAHCVTMLPGGLTLTGVRVGDHDISKERDCEVDANGVEFLCADKYQDFGIESLHYHPQYTARELQNDIALIRLNAIIDFRPISVRAICMPLGSGRMLINSKAIVTGWGVEEEGGPRSPDLLQASLPLVSNEQCKETYKGIVQIWYKQLCAGGHNDGDSCPGDSGGPLQALGMYRNFVKRMIQYGVVSYGPKYCGTLGFPGVYTNVAYYVDWILDTISE